MTILEDESVNIEWWDSLFGGAPGRGLETLRQRYGNFKGLVKVQVSKGKGMKELGFSMQKASFSCGFYVIAAMGAIEIGTEFITRLQYE